MASRINPPPIEALSQSMSAGIMSVLAPWMMQVFRICFSVQQSGTTAQRPTSGDTLWIGRPYFDTTLNKPIWIKQVIPSVVWVDATGATV